MEVDQFDPPHYERLDGVGEHQRVPERKGRPTEREHTEGENDCWCNPTVLTFDEEEPDE